MKKITPLFITAVITLSCTNSDDLNVVLDTSGVVTLSFVVSGSPIANSEIRVSTNSQNFFQLGNVFEGFTDESGNITVGPLNVGTFYYRLDLGNKGFLIESFEVISGNSTNRDIDINQLSSRAEFEVENFNQNVDYSLVNYYLVSYYLISNDVSITEDNNDEILANAIQGTFDTDKVAFESVVSGYYYLYFKVNAELMRAESFFGPLFIQRDYDFSSSLTFPIDLVLMANSWDIIGSTDLTTGNTVSDAFSSVSFDFETTNFTFSDGTTFSTEYSTSTFSNGSIDISLDNTDINESFVWGILDVFYSANGDLRVVYYDQNFAYYMATFN
ncbi:MAG: hypothetical protein AAF620_11920 [Bacteroidota bacterium]